MAVEESIKIKIQANADEFKVVSAAVERSLKEIGKEADVTSSKIKSAGNSIKSTNQQWTNLSLVIQDIPYGFRAIQNNLPALIGGFAAATGPIYLGISAVIAALTVWDEHTRKVASETKKLKEEEKSLNEQLIESTQNARQQGILLSAYVDIARNASLTDKVRNEALEKANKLYGEHNEKLTLANINTEKVKKSVDGYIQSLIQMAVAQKYSDQLANNIIKTDKIQAQIDKKKEQSYALLLEYTGKQTLASRDVVDVMAERRGVEADIAKLESQKAANAQELITLTNKYSDAILKATKLDSEFGKTEAVKTPKVKQVKVKEEKEEKDKYFNILQYTRDFYDVKSKYALDDLEKQKSILKEEQSAYDSLFALKIISDIDYAKRSAEIYKQLADIKKRQDQEAFDNQKKLANHQVNVIDTQLKTQLKLNKDNLIGQQEAVADSMAKVGALMASSFGTAMFPVYLDFYDQLNAKLEAMDTFALRGAAAMERVNSIISDMVSSTFVEFADSMGKSFAGEDIDVFKTFGTILASGLQDIGKALVAYGLAMDAFKKAFSNPVAAVAAGVALIAAGAILKTNIAKTSGENTGVQKFANGGIISGPTMGLMGEYPGAKSNPEVVAPLDKLKDMIGGDGNGVFVLKGQDLLLSVNRAQKASNIKGQNISLA